MIQLADLDLAGMAARGLKVCGVDGAESVSIGAGPDAGLPASAQAEVERLSESQLDGKGEEELACLLELSGEVDSCAKRRKLEDSFILQDAEALLKMSPDQLLDEMACAAQDTETFEKKIKALHIAVGKEEAAETATHSGSVRPEYMEAADSG